MRCQREQYFSRVTPLLGPGLRQACVAVDDLGWCSRVLELLASCRLRLVLDTGGRRPAVWPLTQLAAAARTGQARHETARALLARHLRWKNGFDPLRLCAARGTRRAPDLCLETRLLAPGSAARLRCDPDRHRLLLELPADDWWSWLNLSYHAALAARELLLGRRAWSALDLRLGAPGWPFSIDRRGRPGGRQARPPTPAAGQHVLLIGCGSIGSEVARHLAPAGLAWTVVDGGRVAVHNPLRQWYPTAAIGQPKAAVLADQLGRCGAGPRTAVVASADQALLERLLAARRPALALLTTGTALQLGLAARLWRAGVPHLVALAYEGARYFELQVVDPAAGTPCLHCLRGRLWSGPAAPAPVDDLLGELLYRQRDPRRRAQLYTDLVAEPATAIETGRLADVTALVARAVLAPPARRPGWLRRLLKAGTTCLLGANVAQRSSSGAWAYGLAAAGQVIRCGAGDLAPDCAPQRCEVCGRRLSGPA